VAAASCFSGTFIARSFETLEASNLLEDWDHLAQTMPTHMPFQTAHWNRAWWSIFRRRGIFLKDELHLVCAVRDERLVGVIPLFSTTLGLPGLPLVRYLRLLGADSNLTEWRSVICRPEDRLPLQALWLRESARFRFGLCFLQLRGFTAEEINAAKLEMAGFLRVFPPSEHFVLSLPGSWDSFKATLKRNMKESLRHCYNSLRRANLTPSLSVIGDVEELRARMGLFYEWHALRAKNTGTIEHPDYFNRDLNRQFLETLAQGFCPRGRMKLFELKLNDRPVAYRLGFIDGDTLYLYYSGFDPEFSRFSVMTTLVAEVIKWAINEKIRFVNLSFGRDVSKTRWGPAAIQSYEAVIGIKGLWILQTCRWVVNGTRNLVTRAKRKYSIVESVL
jgi:GNAT acetyltransferase-like protein